MAQDDGQAIEIETHAVPDTRDAPDADALIAAYIEPHPAKSGVANYRLKENYGGYPVWAIIGDLAPGILSEDDIVREFQISRTALDAVLAFYARHKRSIDAWLIVNQEG